MSINNLDGEKQSLWPRLNMQSADILAENIAKIGALFPNCLTERKNERGEVERAIDFDLLRQELSDSIVEGAEERYRFEWPDKKQAMLLAHTPVNKTLRPCVEESVGKDGTPGGFDSENLYIEGDNLEVLKLLRETYLGKVKMIYIDPPYNTGNDSFFKDDFRQTTAKYAENSSQKDEYGNRLTTNTESSGRFHTDWLNMMYPRLRAAQDLLSDDGVIFISIDDHEVENLKKICDEIFDSSNFLNQFIWLNKPEGRQIIGGGAAGTHEYILAYSKKYSLTKEFSLEEEWLRKIMPSSYKGLNYEVNRDSKGIYITTHELYNGNSKFNEETRPTLVFDIYYREADNDIIIEEVSSKHIHEGYIKIEPHKNTDGKHQYHAYRWSREKILSERENLEFIKSGNTYKIYTKRRYFNITNVRDTITDINTNMGSKDINNLNIKEFNYPKPVTLISLFINSSTTYTDQENIHPLENSLILDFFSGSATTAHAVMQLNAEDGGRRKFIMVQLQEECKPESEAFKAGYKNICEIGKERIRRAGKKIKEENAGKEGIEDLDIGFRVLKCDSSNMKDVYYAPGEYSSDLFNDLADNIKEDRTPQDLLFQAMLELGAPLDSKISVAEIAGRRVFNVADNYLLACFDENVTAEVITAIASLQPDYFVMRDSSWADDSVAVNFELIFKQLSPKTQKRVL